MMKDTICVAVGLVGGFFTAIFGGWDSALVTLVVFMAIDFFTGIITAMMKKSKHTESGGLSSKAGWFGLAKKVCTLMLIVVAVRMDILLNTNYIRDAVCISFCLNELLSIVENTSLWVTPHSVGRCRGATEGPGSEGLAEFTRPEGLSRLALTTKFIEPTHIAKENHLCALLIPGGIMSCWTLPTTTGWSAGARPC